MSNNNKKKVAYFRNARVGSSPFIAMLQRLEKENYINKYCSEHWPYEKIKSNCIEKRGVSFWNNSIKLISIRNPWDHHVSMYCMSRKKYLHLKGKDSLAKRFNTLPAKEQDELIKRFREIVMEQLDFVRGETDTLYDKDSKHAISNPKLSCVNRVMGLWATYKLDYIYIHDGKNMADYSVRMEEANLADDLAKFMRAIDVPMDTKCVQGYIAGAKRFNFANSDHYDYRVFYDHDTIQAVKEIRNLEIDLHGYKFE